MHKSRLCGRIYANEKKLGGIMERATLGELIETLEKGTKLHISITFLDECGNRKTQRTRSQSIHDSPVCMTIKHQQGKLSSCYRCRNIVQKAVIKHRKAMGGVCINGVYEYCHPGIYGDRVICVIFIGNMLTADPRQRERLGTEIGKELLQTMEQDSNLEDCVKIANVLDSYIQFLFDRYGIENTTFDPLLENIKNYIRENLSYGFSMEELAGAFHYTPKYLGYLFKSRTGETIKNYCNHLKILQAKTLLEETDMSIEDVAIRVGFNSVTYFDRVFCKKVKLSPQAYRASAKK